MHALSAQKPTCCTLKALIALILILLPLALTGCMDITGRGPAPLARTVDVERDRPLAGHVYCMRGWLGIFSTGMDALAIKIDTEVKAVSVADEEWLRLKDFIIKEHKAGRLQEPLILLGHSWGADDQIRVAQALEEAGITVDLLVTIDPVTPPAIPSNVKRCYNVYKSHPATDAVPFWRGVAVDQTTTKVPVTNIDLRTTHLPFDTELLDHINIEKSDGVHRMVMEEIRKVCPPRQAFNRARAEGRSVAEILNEMPPTAATPTPHSSVTPAAIVTPNNVPTP